MPDDLPAVELQGLTKRYAATTAVDDLSLAVRRGRTLGLLGPNGAGKSTTMRMLMGTLRPDSGTVHVLGTDVFRAPSLVKQRVGYVPETHNIYRWMTVKQVLRFTKAMYRTWNEETCENLMDMFRLPPSRRVRQLSKGMLAKLSLLVALAHEPDLLVLDEPLSGLDPIARDEFLDGVLQGICRDDHTVIFSSHQLDEVNRLADEVAIVNNGRLLVHCDIDQLVGSAKRIRAVLEDGRLPSTLPAEAIWQNVDRREWQVTLYPYSESTLERIRAANAVREIEVLDIGLDDIFKDFIRGQA